MENNTLWEEKGYTEHERSYLSNTDLDNKNIIENTENKNVNEPLKHTSKISGIYIILNKINNKYYIGSSNNIIEIRWKDHKSKLKNNNHINSKLQHAWNKYGEENFEFHIVDLIEESQLLIVEQKYLDYAKLHKERIYNLSFVANRGEMTDEIKQKISKANKGKRMSDEHYKRASKRMKKDNPMFDFNVVNKVRMSMSGRLTGINNPFYGKHHTDETKKKQSKILSVPKKPLLTFTNIVTKETKTLGRIEWYKQHGVYYQSIIKGGKSKSWSLYGSNTSYRKPTITCINVVTGETATYGRSEWKIKNVDYRIILKNGKSNNWIKWNN